MAIPATAPELSDLLEPLWEDGRPVDPPAAPVEDREDDVGASNETDDADVASDVDVVPVGAAEVVSVGGGLVGCADVGGAVEDAEGGLSVESEVVIVLPPRQLLSGPA